MAHDFSVLLYKPALSELGVDATMNGVAIAVIDETRAKTQTANGVEVRSIGPAACAHIPELTAKGITVDVWKGATLSFNGDSWTVRNWDKLGSPNGEDFGWVRFLLMAVP